MQKGVAKNAIEWMVTPHAVPGWQYVPVVQVSQVGYHPSQQKVAIIEMDVKDKVLKDVELIKISDNGQQTISKTKPKVWGKFLRYQYARFDFSAVKEPGMYMIKYGTYQTEPFQINKDVFKRNVWQPTLEYFLPAQMCHMRINDRYKVWHGLCHMDDALMAPVSLNHFDGYVLGASSLTGYKSGDRVPGLNKGGWHDAGDFDLRVESQAETVHGLSLAYEHFKNDYDNTAIDQKNHLVELHQPDGKADILQQIEHGAFSIVGGYKSLGRYIVALFVLPSASMCFWVTQQIILII